MKKKKQKYIAVHRHVLFSISNVWTSLYRMFETTCIKAQEKNRDFASRPRGLKKRHENTTLLTLASIGSWIASGEFLRLVYETKRDFESLFSS